MNTYMNKETIDTTTIRDGEIDIEYMISSTSKYYISIDEQYILFSEMLGILRILRMYIHDSMSGFYIVPIKYKDESYGTMWIIVYGGKSIELLCEDATIELSVAELLNFARFVSQQLRKA